MTASTAARVGVNVLVDVGDGVSVGVDVSVAVGEGVRVWVIVALGDGNIKPCKSDRY